jgi:hypothetical protein
MTEYYKFAAYIFALVVVAVLIARLAFGGVKRRLRELDEREASLLKLYRDIEKLSDSFHEEAEDALDALREAEVRIYNYKTAPNNTRWTDEPAPDITVSDTPLVGQMQIPGMSPSPADDTPAEKPRRASRREAVLSLSKAGLETDDIARELSITKNEVALIIGLLADNN